LAPEVLKGEEYSNKVDIYAFGVLLWEMLTRKAYMDVNFFYVMRETILSGVRPEIPSDCKPELRQLIELCWANDPNTRPSINECLESLVNALTAYQPELLPIAMSERQSVQITASTTTKYRNTVLMHPAAELIDSVYVSSTLDSECQGSIQTLLYVPEYEQIWCGDSSGSVSIFSEDGRLLRSTKIHEKRVTSLWFIKPNIWSCSFDNTVRVNLPSGGLLKEFKSMTASTVIKVQGSIWIGTYDMEVLILNKKVSL